MNKYYIKYECEKNEENKYKSTIEIMKEIYDKTIIINEWYVGDDCGILIIECENFFNTKIKLKKYFNIIEYKEIYNINKWLDNYENYKCK